MKSAISNAENNYQFDIDNLFVKEAYVGKSLVMKRFRPRAKGRASPIKKPFSRITIVLEEKRKESGQCGTKINPIGLRLIINRVRFYWFAKKKDFGKYLIEDFKIRKYIKNIINSGVSEVIIERSSNAQFQYIKTRFCNREKRC